MDYNYSKGAAPIDIQEFIDAAKIDLTDIENFIQIPEDTIPLFGDVYLALET